MRKIELLSPARNADIGIEAINHGADAVYIGAPRFGARAAAGNAVADIARLAAYGHRYGARTFVALNTILTDAEVDEAVRVAWLLYEAGVDALIVQDWGLIAAGLPPVELHASTQMDNRTIDKVRLLRDLGMTRVVLARELSIAQIRAIHEAVDVELECFVHGALCVSVSGQCYLSAALTGRSANRGQCAQPCRLPMDLTDGHGRTLAAGRHLLSLKDMNRSAALADMMEAGVTSFKIEGRLKDMAYVKNVTAYYRQQLDTLLAGRSDAFRAASDGQCVYTFEPRPAASFNRGFTTYYIYGGRETAAGRAEEIWNADTPKAMGEAIGPIVRTGRGFFTMGRECAVLHNGDGLVARDGQGRVVGFRLNRIDAATSRLYPADGVATTARLSAGMKIYRNVDYQFDQLLQRPSATRRISVDATLRISPDEIVLTLADDRGCHAEARREARFDVARSPQREQYVRQLSRLGDTCFALRRWEVRCSDDTERFVPASLLADVRREAADGLRQRREEYFERQRRAFRAPDYAARAATLDARHVAPPDYLANVMNRRAADLLRQMKVEAVAEAFEQNPHRQGPVMFTRHCLKFALGCCPRYQNPRYVAAEPWQLKIGDKNFLVKFGCENDCLSEIFVTFATPN